MTGKEHWRIEKRRDISGCGKLITSKVNAYIKTWRNRCYSDDIPDQVPDQLMLAGLAPSYKAIAMAILLNRWQLLGIYPEGTLFFENPAQSNQLRLL